MFSEDVGLIPKSRLRECYGNTHNSICSLQGQRDAYSFEVPAELKDGVTHTIQARVLGSTYDLKDSGKALTCYSSTRLSAESGSGLQVRVLGNPVSDAVSVEIRGAERQPLRLVLSDQTGRLVTERMIGQARLVEQQTFSVQGKPAGLLLLRVSNGTQSMRVKVVKQ